MIRIIAFPLDIKASPMKRSEWGISIINLKWKYYKCVVKILFIAMFISYFCSLFAATISGNVRNMTAENNFLFQNQHPDFNDSFPMYKIPIDEITNITYKRIKTLVNSFWDKGEHSVLWNWLDENGHSVSSGVYFYVMKTDNYTETCRMLLLK